MQEFHTQLKTGGRVVIPLECRNALKIKEGDEIVILITDNNEAMIYSLEHAINKARKIVKKRVKKPNELVKDLLTTRRNEAKND